MKTLKIRFLLLLLQFAVLAFTWQPASCSQTNAQLAERHLLSRKKLIKQMEYLVGECNKACEELKKLQKKEIKP